MSLVQGYSSGEDEDYSKDAFGLSSIPASKKIRADVSATPVVAVAAPDVLSEVSLLSHSLVACA